MMNTEEKTAYMNDLQSEAISVVEIITDLSKLGKDELVSMRNVLDSFIDSAISLKK